MLLACQLYEEFFVSCRNVLPIAALFAGTLWLGNAAYLYLSVAFIQMLKVSMHNLQHAPEQGIMVFVHSSIRDPPK